MCGIVGCTGARAARPLLPDGLSALEYRGYDSAGIALCHADGTLERTRAVGALSALRDRVPALASGGAEPEPTAGIGHTRWATHGAVTEANAHPHADASGRVQIVLNGIVENWQALRERLRADGVELTSETDAEVVAHLVGERYDGDLARAVGGARGELRGRFSFVAVAAGEPGVLVGVRRRTPLVAGVGDGEAFLASAVAAFAAETPRVVELEDAELVTLGPDGDVEIAGRPHARVTLASTDHAPPDREGFETFMRKEIAEQPAALARTLLEQLDVPLPPLAGLRAIRIVGCGTSYHAGLAARELLEAASGLPVEVEIASEHRQRPHVARAGELVIGVTQSGETADTLTALHAARDRGSPVLTLTNVADSQAARDADAVLLTRAGAEVGVAATKTFSTQVAALAALALRLGGDAGGLAGDLAALPERFERAIAVAEPWARAVAPRVADAPLAMFLGRGPGAAIAAEGALKLKEIAYVPADAYPAGEMKHGPIALLSAQTPVICVATAGPALAQLRSNLAEVRTRGAHVLAVAGDAAADGDAAAGGDAAGAARAASLDVAAGAAHAASLDVAADADDVVRVPDAGALSALVAVVPLQLLVYHAARVLGRDVDRPRNLAKTVTVE
ncbi:MAG TPA: glutamine--fructose-6-phosphate transaminase (isomerizing) [Solirubrobacter sp.]|nr:glutamine--fructose-6-phosphate transaminase (isomerizing) [Solirubrobacter sp.]